MDNVQQTYFMIKPDGIKRSLTGRILARLEQSGLKLIYARMIWATAEQAKGNYPGTEEWLIGMGEKTRNGYDGNDTLLKKEMGTTDPLEIGTKIYEQLVEYLISGPMLATVWQGNHAVEIARKLTGATRPQEADLGSIRGDFGFDSPQLAVRSGRIAMQTLVHVSDSEEEAEREIAYWLGDKFTPMKYERTDHLGYGVTY
ncbi:nucleoside-diphosphate kinase [Candidatus Dojkabacteria bacterium]|uniref:nucleoside-diphosphate kinase n=1 Tax=Candidatus Dojkabacteria bacterium TaxID=2099670 RepID=A0A955L842_9BACT|nr:nucleoside-diphosphate kinase [Candidatus Dojkabacteria bacterium]